MGLFFCFLRAPSTADVANTIIFIIAVVIIVFFIGVIGLLLLLFYCNLNQV